MPAASLQLGTADVCVIGAQALHILVVGVLGSDVDASALPHNYSNKKLRIDPRIYLPTAVRTRT